MGGSITLLLSIAATAYPTALRATGIIWAMAWVGQMAIPIPIGLLVGAGAAPQVALATRNRVR